MHAITCCCQFVRSGISAQYLHAVTPRGQSFGKPCSLPEGLKAMTHRHPCLCGFPVLKDKTMDCFPRQPGPARPSSAMEASPRKQLGHGGFAKEASRPGRLGQGGLVRCEWGFPRITCMPSPASASLSVRHFRVVLACRHLLVGFSAFYLHAITCCCPFVRSGISAQYSHVAICWWAFPRSTCMPTPAAASLSVPEFPRNSCTPPPAAAKLSVPEIPSPYVGGILSPYVGYALPYGGGIPPYVGIPNIWGGGVYPHILGVYSTYGVYPRMGVYTLMWGP